MVVNVCKSVYVNVWKSVYTGCEYEMPVDWTPQYPGWKLVAIIKK